MISAAAAPQRLALASASPRRLALLEQIGLRPDEVLPANIDEAPRLDERPRNLALRLALEKGRAAQKSMSDTTPAYHNFIIATATTVSGRAHDVITAVAVSAPDGREGSRVVESRVTFKRLSHTEVEGYVASGEWKGKAGGYAIQGQAGAFVTDISGSYSAIVGLPLYETASLLEGLGYLVARRWEPRA